jgi:ABC-type multidrug transport system ATPase subunit
MKVLRDLAKGGRTVVTTIHQPNSYIFGLFDQLMLLSAGEVVYYGPASQAHVYFSRLGYELPLRVNPADFFGIFSLCLMLIHQ